MTTAGNRKINPKMNAGASDSSDEDGITDDDRRQIRRYLQTHPARRSVDDLRPEAEGD